MLLLADKNNKRVVIVVIIVVYVVQVRRVAHRIVGTTKIILLKLELILGFTLFVINELIGKRF